MPAFNSMPLTPDFVTENGLKVVVLTRGQISNRLSMGMAAELDTRFPGEAPLAFGWIHTSRWEESDPVWVADEDDMRAREPGEVRTTVVDVRTAPPGALYLTIDHENNDDDFWVAIGKDPAVSVYEAKMRAVAMQYGRAMFIDPAQDAEIIKAFKALPGAEGELRWLTAAEANGYNLV